MKEPCAPARRRRAAGALPRVEPEVVVIVSGSEESRARVAGGDVEPEDIDVEALRALEVGDLQMHVADRGARVERGPGRA